MTVQPAWPPSGNQGAVDDDELHSWARNPDALISGAITRDANGAATSAPVTWPDGTPGLYTGVASATFPGSIDSYTITYGSTTVLRTYNQPAMSRDPVTGVVTNRPAITVT